MGATSSNLSSQPPAQGAGGGCPVNHGGVANGSANNIPADLANVKASSLSIEREVSSIPRSSSDEPQPPSGCPMHSAKGKEVERWAYPSPQQFQNALARKGKEAPEESVATMVQIHNFLNERAWQEVVRLEDSRPSSTQQKVELARFTGRPSDLSPKARYHLLLGRLFPNSYNTEPPFDRHDWYVRRPADNTVQRYVIDYYSAPDDEQGNPVFSLDVRPAIDSPSALYSRLSEWARVKRQRWSEVWDTATPASSR